ncbi:ribosome assembly RNA-binding protein YhbY [Thiotrichales bacterium 19S11-10]|nr:ribosome assembly RNA-binding protein YhbY [Thiotrichales bacterium 19S11-10]MCF6807351.1 ribosome assembly RNA-binding protein YhbY [Thiotrichales bacterium 19S9-11]MCF6811320.1 ribosome assembly RNA-binding protein YhbY [Thiotrichales bacterium 19S9-12]
MTLNSKQKQTLKAQAHHLDAIIWTGDKGLTENVLFEIDQALDHHELIKIKLAADRVERQSMAKEICQKLHCELIQQIGRVIVLYRKSNKDKKTS